MGRRRAFLALALLEMFACLALGGWQLERRAWKLDLIARVQTRIHAQPRAIPRRAQWPRVNRRDDEYRRVRVKGVYLNRHETFVQAVTERGAGYWVITPLATSEGTVLVNRGFVPPELRDASIGPARQIERPVVVTGLLRMSEPGGGFLRANDPANGRWYSRDVALIARARRLGRVAPFFIDADAAAGPGGYPVGGLTVVVFRNPHLIYALTWFSLAALGAAASVGLMRKSQSSR